MNYDVWRVTHSTSMVFLDPRNDFTGQLLGDLKHRVRGKRRLELYSVEKIGPRGSKGKMVEIKGNGSNVGC